MPVLIDTCIFYSKFNQSDKQSEVANNIYRDLLMGKYGEIYLLDYVFDELMTLIQVRTKRNDLASTIGKVILDATHSYLNFLQTDLNIFTEAWNLFQNQRERKYLSFTDCVLIATSKLLGIEYIATFEGLFKPFVKVVDF